MPNKRLNLVGKQNIDMLGLGSTNKMCDDEKPAIQKVVRSAPSFMDPP